MALPVQQIFNMVSHALIRQNKKCIRRNSPAYKNGNLRCAVGTLISDECYLPIGTKGAIDLPSGGLGLENEEVIRALENSGSITKHDRTNVYMGILTKRMRLLYALQDVHDSAHPNQWPERLREVARKFELDSEIVNRAVNTRKKKTK